MLQHRQLFTGLLSAMTLLHTTSATASTEGPVISATGALLKTSGMLALVLALIYGLSWLLKKQNFQSIGQGRHLTLIESMPVGKNEKLCLVKSGQRYLVLGISPGGIHQIDEIPADQMLDSSPANNGWQWAHQFLNRQ